MKPPILDNSFRFPPDHCFTPDRIATEYRMLIRGYLAQAEHLFSTEARVQEIRDCATRIYELTTALSAHELRTYFAPVEKSVSCETGGVKLDADQIPDVADPNVSRETGEGDTQ